MLFFFNDTATTEIYTLSLHDALPISVIPRARRTGEPPGDSPACAPIASNESRSEEHTSELQSQSNLVCRLLLGKKNKRRAAASASSPLLSSTATLVTSPSAYSRTLHA